jgi:hypothetical protein
MDELRNDQRDRSKIQQQELGMLTRASSLSRLLHLYSTKIPLPHTTLSFDFDYDTESLSNSFIPCPL